MFGGRAQLAIHGRKSQGSATNEIAARRYAGTDFSANDPAFAGCNVRGPDQRPGCIDVQGLHLMVPASPSRFRLSLPQHASNI